MRVKQLLAVSLSAALALPANSFAQRTTPAPLESANAASPSISTVPPGIATGVFGTYGGAESRFSGATGIGSGGALTPQAERKLGERVMRDVRRDPDYLDDWLVRDYLNAVAKRLAAAASARYIGGYAPDFDLFAVRDPQINAFSMPGGFIGINSGLVVATQTESELASVIGHEMGHVLQRHIARMIGANEKTGYTALATMLLGVLAGVLARSGDLGSAIAMGGQAFAVDNQLRFSRTAEREADRVGFQLLAGAGYDPYGMPGFFERLERASMGDAGVPAYGRADRRHGRPRAARAVPSAASVAGIRFRARAAAGPAEPCAERHRGRSAADAARDRRSHRAERRGERVRHRAGERAARTVRRGGSRARHGARSVRCARAPRRRSGHGLAEPRRAGCRHRATRGA